MADARSAHDVYADRLRALQPPDALLDVVGQSLGGGWRRTYGRFLPYEPRYATLVFERTAPSQALVTVDVFEGDRPDAGGTCVRVPALGWLRLTSFPADDRLPTLPEALQAARAMGDTSVVRYRPGRRCTLRAGDSADVRYGKVFPDAAGRIVHEVGVTLAAACREGALGFHVAAPLTWDAARRVLWQAGVPGTPLLDRLSTSDAADLAGRMGAALGTLHASNVPAPVRFDAAAQCARSAAYARELADRVPALARETTALREALDAVHHQRPGRVRPIHGAPHVNQWLEDGDRLALVDFDRLSLGDPELDVATFLGELDFEEELATPVQTIAAAFVAGCERTGGTLDPALLRAYRAHKRLAKALRSARALRADGATRARRHLASAWAALHGRD